MRRPANILLIATFAGLLWLPTVDSFVHLSRPAGFNEKRLPARFPSRNPGIRGLQQYLHGLEDYFNDHFGLRQQLIDWHLRCQINVFKEKITRDVLLGRKGWLFYCGEGTHASETGHFSEHELVYYQHLLEDRRDWLAQRGAHYVFVVAPDKQSVYPEFLPSGWKATHPRTRLDEFLDYMKAHSTVMVVDLRPALREARRMAPTYFKTDSHWNDFGGFVACSEIGKVLSNAVPAVKPLSVDSFKLTRTETKGQDLADMIGARVTEELVQLLPKPDLPRLVETVENPDFVCPTYFATNSNASGSVVVFRDSFGTALKPFLGYYFGRSAYFWTVGDFDPVKVEGIKPTVVISELVERHLDRLQNSHNLRPPVR